MAKRLSKAVRLRRLRTERAGQVKLVRHLRSEWASVTRKLDRAAKKLDAIEERLSAEESK